MAFIEYAVAKQSTDLQQFAVLQFTAIHVFDLTAEFIMTNFLMKLDSDSKFHSLCHLETVPTLILDFRCLQGVLCIFNYYNNKLTLYIRGSTPAESNFW